MLGQGSTFSPHVFTIEKSDIGVANNMTTKKRTCSIGRKFAPFTIEMTTGVHATVPITISAAFIFVAVFIQNVQPALALTNRMSRRSLAIKLSCPRRFSRRIRPQIRLRIRIRPGPPRRRRGHAVVTYTRRAVGRCRARPAAAHRQTEDRKQQHGTGAFHGVDGAAKALRTSAARAGPPVVIHPRAGCGRWRMSGGHRRWRAAGVRRRRCPRPGR